MTKAEKVGLGALATSLVSFVACLLTWQLLGDRPQDPRGPWTEVILNLLLRRTWDVGLLGLVIYSVVLARGKLQAYKRLRERHEFGKGLTGVQQVARWLGIFSGAAFLVALVCVLLASLLVDFLDDASELTPIRAALILIGLLFGTSVAVGYPALCLYVVTTLAARVQPQPAHWGSRVANWSGATAVAGILSTLVSWGAFWVLARIPDDPGSDLQRAFLTVVMLTVATSLLAVVLGFIGYVGGRIVAAAKSEG